MKGDEIIANLWYVMNLEGYIADLRAKLYVSKGTDREKLDFLRSRAELDYMVARSFLLPAGIQTSILGPRGESRYRAIHIDDAHRLGGPTTLFEEAFNILSNELPEKTHLSIPQDPLVVVTPLHRDEDGSVFPAFTARGST